MVAMKPLQLARDDAVHVDERGIDRVDTALPQFDIQGLPARVKRVRARWGCVLSSDLQLGGRDVESCDACRMQIGGVVVIQADVAE